MPIERNPHGGSHRAQLGDRDRPHSGARKPAAAVARAARRVARIDRAGLDRINHRDRVGTASSAACATAAGSATLGVSLTIRGLAVRGRTASRSAAGSAGCSPTISPEPTLGQETLSSIAGHLLPFPQRCRRDRRTPPAGTHHQDDQRNSSLGQPRKVLGQKPVPAPCWEPDRVDHSRRGLPDSLAARCLHAARGVIVLETKAENGKSYRSGSP